MTITTKCNVGQEAWIVFCKNGVAGIVKCRIKDIEIRQFESCAFIKYGLIVITEDQKVYDMKQTEKKYRITLSERQLHLIINCVEDIHRFMGGQTELDNCTAILTTAAKSGKHSGKYTPSSSPNSTGSTARTHATDGTAAPAQMSIKRNSSPRPTTSTASFATN